jgi:IS5 family transposase
LLRHEKTIVNATLIAAPHSTKNRDQARDRDMHRMKRDKQWYFDMKARIGIDSRTKLIHAMVATAANVADARCCPISPWRGNPCVRRSSRPTPRDPSACAAGTGLHYGATGSGAPLMRLSAKNRSKSTVRAPVEHPFHMIKRVRVRQSLLHGLEKNATRLFVAYARRTFACCADMSCKLRGQDA